ncbi:hypothetical protein [Methylosinus sporium]|uniref:LamG domain-containing protein n=1 Tax=Methylosinus sporium TaxID=428 RepID=A0A2U1SSQ7_METSR|nr:hypothetical protein [Methylosinus sporium]PWB94647.1 hypothetical protein C5689_06180 [Methylosinus sporium]
MLGLGLSLSNIAVMHQRGPTPVISIQSGGGYAGAVYAASVAGGQWYADGVAIIGATSQTWTMTAAYEGAAITYRVGARASNAIELWVVSDLGAPPFAQFDARVSSSIMISSPYITSWSSLVGSLSASSVSGAQPTYSATAIGGNPGAVCDGVNDFLATAPVAHPAAWTVQIVAKKTALGTLKILAAADDEVLGRQAQLLRVSASNKIETVAFNTSGAVALAATTTSISAGAPFIAAAVHQTSPTKVLTAYLNDAGSGSVTPGGTPRTLSAALSIGAGLSNGNPVTPFDGAISELIYISRDVTTDERQKLAAYSAWRFGLEASLDMTNPYRTAPPFVTAP